MKEKTLSIGNKIAHTPGQRPSAKCFLIEKNKSITIAPSTVKQRTSSNALKFFEVLDFEDRLKSKTSIEDNHTGVKKSREKKPESSVRTKTF